MADPREEADEWLKLGQGVRSKLLARKGEIKKQRGDLDREEAEIDSRLKLIPEPPPTPGEKLLVHVAKAVVEIGRSYAEAQTLPGMIRVILESTPTHEMASKDLVEKILKAKPELENTRIHSELFRMKDRKQIGAKGDRPHTVYYLLPKPKEAAVSP